jgi:hypothetical protein
VPPRSSRRSRRSRSPPQRAQRSEARSPWAIAALAHGASDPPLSRDLLTSGWIGALGGATYAAYFSFAATFGARGGGRSAALIIDWILGAGSGASALFFPRAHLRNLVGGEAALEMSQRSATIALLLLATFFSLFAVTRAAIRAR